MFDFDIHQSFKITLLFNQKISHFVIFGFDGIELMIK